MKWFGAMWGAVSEYFKFRNRLPEKDIEAREAEKTETKGLKSDIRQIRLTKKKMKRFRKWYKWALRNDFIKDGEDKYDAYERYQIIQKSRKR